MWALRKSVVLSMSFGTWCRCSYDRKWPHAPWFLLPLPCVAACTSGTWSVLPTWHSVLLCLVWAQSDAIKATEPYFWAFYINCWNNAKVFEEDYRRLCFTFPNEVRKRHLYILWESCMSSGTMWGLGVSSVWWWLSGRNQANPWVVDWSDRVIALLVQSTTPWGRKYCFISWFHFQPLLSKCLKSLWMKVRPAEMY